MKINSKWMTMAAVLTLSASMAVAAPHEGGKRGGRHGRGHGGEFSARMAEKLNLSDAQKQQVRDLQRSFRVENQAFFENAKDTRRQLREAKKAGDTARFEALKGTFKAQRETMKQLRQAQHERILAVLTAEQRAQLETLKAERKARRDERRGQRGDRN